jgi:imidazolonepropionase-like amidohydrolase
MAGSLIHFSTITEGRRKVSTSMRRPQLHRHAIVLFAALLLICSSVFAQIRAPAGLALVGGTVYVSPTEKSIPNGIVLIENGTIAAVGPRGTLRIPSGIETIDCSGLIVTAGFWNSHVHFIEKKWANSGSVSARQLADQLREMVIQYGFTTVFDTGSNWQNTRRLRERIESGEVPGPRIRSAGTILYPEGGSPLPKDYAEPVSSSELLAAAKKVLDSGTDGVKIVGATWRPPIASFTQADVRATVEEAHRRGKPVLAHPENITGLLAAVRGGVDVVLHTTATTAVWGETVLTSMREARVALVPTLKLYEFEVGRLPLLQRVMLRVQYQFGSGVLTHGIAQLRAWNGTGGTVLFGTDVGYMTDYNPTEEYVLMNEAGMTFNQILASLTTAPAERFGDSDRLGKLSPGFVADAVVLRGDPSKDVRALASVRYTIRDGKVIYRASN